MKSIGNIITYGLSGKLDGLVFRNVNGECIVSRAPRKTTKKPTEAQLKSRQRFIDAAKRAKEILSDPAQFAYYKVKAARKHVSAFQFVQREIMQGSCKL